LPVCKRHHLQIHRGEYDADSLKSLFNTFWDKGIGFKKYKADKLIKIVEAPVNETQELKKPI
jgi:hypothetical protein